MADLFISYSRKDADRALQLVNDLKKDGLSVWIDQHGIDVSRLRQAFECLVAGMNDNRLEACLSDGIAHKTGAIFVKGSVSTFNPKTLRASAGSLFRAPFVSGLNAPSTLAALRQHGVDIYATVPAGNGACWSLSSCE